MNDDDHEPSRLDTLSSEPSFLRDALAAARDERPADRDVTRLAERLSVATGVAIAPPSAPPAPSCSSDLPPTPGTSSGAEQAWWVGTKAKIGLAVVVLGGGAAYLGTRADTQVDPTTVHATVVTPATSASTREIVGVATSAPVTALPSASAATGSVPPAPSALAPASATPAASRSLRVESPLEVEPEAVLLERARTQLASSPASALATTEETAHAYPRGVLSQEREVLAIDALMRLGRRGEAELRATTFRARHPASAYLRRIDRLLGADQKVEP